MLKKWITGLLLALAVTLAGCSQTLSIQALKPAEVDRAASLKQVAILPLEHDKGQYRINMAAKLEAGLSNYRIEDRSYFTVVSRSELPGFWMSRSGSTPACSVRRKWLKSVV